VNVQGSTLNWKGFVDGSGDTAIAVGYFIVGTTTHTTDQINERISGASKVGESSFPHYPCGISDLSGCLQNALNTMFYPSQNIVEQFKGLELEDKFPFAYAYDLNDVRQEMFGTSSTASTSIAVNVPHFGSITFLSTSMISAVPYASVIKTILGWLLWFMMAEYLYFRIIRSHDSQTPS